ncbi:hypothetical protein N9W89_11375 [Hellea sp.]|nr:hypothetical protein [Hellea sp.]
MNKLNKNSKVKTLFGMLAILAFSWLVLYLYLMLSPTVALESCADNSGIWSEEKQKCYCEQERGEDREICIAKLAEELKRTPDR